MKLAHLARTSNIIFKIWPLLLTSVALSADPLISSWYTERSGSYARLYETDADQAGLNAVTTWSRGAGVQTYPTYAGVNEISYTEDWLYIRSTNLASYIMGPWYGNLARTNLFINYPANQAVIYRFPRDPVDPATFTPKSITGGGPIGYMVDGVAMFDSRDAFSYDPGTGNEVNGAGDWNRDAYVNESQTFDAGFAHQAQSRYHYHANTPALRHQLGDSVDYDAATNNYTENFNGDHSPIIGWVRDGIPVYGPYGYSDPIDASSAVRRMISGYQIRSGLTTRDSWPEWANDVYGAANFSAGPNVSATFPLGRYLEDNEYKGDVSGFDLYEGVIADGAYSPGTDYDLNEYNVRWCVTPEYPAGTWAYFTCIDVDGTPVVPYNIGRVYFGSPTGNTASDIPETDDTVDPLVVHFEGGPEKTESVKEILVDSPAADQITLTWSAIEGGTYEISETSDLSQEFVGITPTVLATSDSPSVTHIPGGTRPAQNFYQLARTDLEYFDDTGFVYDDPVLPPVDLPVSITVTMDGGPPNTGVSPVTLTFNGQAIDVASSGVSRPTQTTLTFDAPLYGLAPGTYTIVATYPMGPNRNGTYTVYPNILLMIVDDWGIDRSPLDNTASATVLLPNMPNLESLAASGLRFTNAYAQPTCSPTRATIMTGRQPYQHGVSTPTEAGQFSGGSGIDEITLPEIFTSEGAPQAMLTVGKWHLGGNTSGYSTRGGWPEFYGITSGGVPDYYSWTKNSNGSNATSTTYTTTDQVNEATKFMLTKNAEGTAWFTWVAFNAPHSPFQEPPAALAPAGGYSVQDVGEGANDYNYRLSLEALDTEIGRMMESLDPAKTHIIIIGDNGTPGQTVQEPFGGTPSRAKGSLYEGGTHVPMIVSGPAVTVTPGSTSDKLVHCVDLFSTILEMADIDESLVTGLSAMNVSSQSVVPILSNSDTADRVVIVEGGETNKGRAIILDDYPDYKLIIFGDPDSTTDDPVFEFYNIDTDPNEQSPLAVDITMTYEIDPSLLTGDALDAYNACVAKDTALGGGYSDLPVAP